MVCLIFIFYIKLVGRCTKLFSSHNEFWGKPTLDYSNGFLISDHSNVDDISKDFLFSLPYYVLAFLLLAFSLGIVLIYICP